ncbi:S1 family peptidase [Wenzhouxiangella sp. AB-CW3]|uniref:S1 family peptidase n=1 Tax=Wenzhouxiangella sp. AB-CW3 TaxID=2771012 RepID=UPI00168BCA88|nr:S1 family peptidase [Wenzhouxiangella sp. AB-CW3]QOC22393.1 S1 family peptidase [Wenzhouxiangella sp. AB-CW3]
MKSIQTRNNRRHAGVFLFASTFFLSVSSQVFSSDLPPEELDIPSDMATAIERDLGLSQAEFQRTLRMEREAGSVLSRAASALGDNYGGSWIERDENGEVRAVVAATSRAAVQGNPGLRGLDRAAARTEVREVRFSLAELEQTVESFNRASGNPMARSLNGIHSWGIDLPNNRVVVVASPDVSDRVLDFFARSRADLDMVHFEVSEHEPSTLVNVVGGFRYNGCSIGFAVRRGSTPGFVTAGHCGSVGQIVRINGVAVGRFQRSNFPGADAAWANVRRSDTLHNLVWRYSGNSTYAVTGSNEAPLGATVCRSGFRTGWRCGTLTRNNVTVNYGSGPVHGLRESNACAGQGDSGGSWVAGGNQAQGVTSGGALGGDGTNCGIPQNQRRTWFQRLNPMLSGYGLNLVTS